MYDVECGELKTIVTEYECAMRPIEKPDSSDECQVDCLRNMTTHVCVVSHDYQGNQCFCSAHMSYQEEANRCGRTCYTYHQSEYCQEPEEMLPGCVCKDEMVYDEVIGDCVKPEFCSCLMDPVDPDNNGVFEFLKSVVNGEIRHFDVCYNESRDNFPCTAECADDQLKVQHDCFCSYGGVKYDVGEVIPDHVDAQECEEAYCENKHGQINFREIASDFNETECLERGPQWDVSYENGTCNPMCVKNLSDWCREHYIYAPLNFTWARESEGKNGLEEEYYCETDRPINYTACAGSCGTGGFKIELGRHLETSLGSDCTCCSPGFVETEALKFTCWGTYDSRTVTLAVPTKQADCRCNTCIGCDPRLISTSGPIDFS